MILQLLSSLIVLTGTLSGVILGYYFSEEYSHLIDIERPELALSALFGFVGYLFFSLFGRALQKWVEDQIEKTSSIELAWGGLGLLLGLISANLLFVPLYFLLYNHLSSLSLDNNYFDTILQFFIFVLPISFNLFAAYLGIRITLKFKRFHTRAIREGMRAKIIDTSAIIDGRFSDLFKLGFLDGEIIVPRFVVNELQFLADSSEEIKRARGRDGLANLNKVKEALPDRLIITEKDFPEVSEVDAKLIHLAKDLDSVLITQDFSLKKVAELDEIKVLNINDLVNALKPIFVSGESIELKIVKKGKDACQGVGFLSDGTMVVVEDGGDHVGQTVTTTVTNILQTGAGRMIFCQIGNKE